MFALAITTWNGTPDAKSKKGAPSGQRLTIQLAGSRQQCERFCDGLKKGLREGVKEVENLRAVVAECYSEYLLADEGEGTNNEKEHPDTGLGMIFRYPGNARKLRDATKIRLWKEYLKGAAFQYSLQNLILTHSQKMDEVPHSYGNLRFISSFASAFRIDYEGRYGSLHQARFSYDWRNRNFIPKLLRSFLGESLWLLTRLRKI
jgi:hypothetical protein